MTFVLLSCMPPEDDEATEICACYDSALDLSGQPLRQAIQDCDGERAATKAQLAGDAEASAAAKAAIASCMKPLRRQLAEKARQAKKVAGRPNTAVKKRSLSVEARR
jgi:hypothetical protein